MSFAALALRARAANDTTRAQINNIPEKSHFIVLLQVIEADSTLIRPLLHTKNTETKHSQTPCCYCKANYNVTLANTEHPLSIMPMYGKSPWPLGS